MSFSVTHALRSLRSSELIVLQAPAKPSPSALNFLAASRAGAPSAPPAAGGSLELQ